MFLVWRYSTTAVVLKRSLMLCMGGDSQSLACFLVRYRELACHCQAKSQCILDHVLHRLHEREPMTRRMSSCPP